MEKCLRKYKVLLIFMLISIRKSINLLLPNSAPLTNVSAICSVSFEGPRAKMEEPGLHLPVLLAGALSAPALQRALSASWELELFLSSPRPACSFSPPQA